jgi:hypothetical protein
VTAACKDKRFRKVVRDLFLGRQVSTPAGTGSLDDHLATCASCQSLFQTLASADRALGEGCGAPDVISPMEIDMAWHGLHEKLSLPPSGRGMRLWHWLIPASAAGFAAILLLVLTPWKITDREAGEYVARGAKAPPSVECVCIPAGGTGKARPARRSAALDACRIDENLGFTYLNPGGRYSGLALYAVGPDDQVLWYLPNPAEPEGFRPGEADRPRALPRTIRISVNHREGDYRLVAIFMPEPLDFPSIRDIAPSVASGRNAPIGSYTIRRTLRVEGEKP